MKRYEGLFILETAGKEEGIKDAIDKISQEITTAGGKEKVDAFCADLLASAGPGGESTDHPGDTPTSRPTATPAGHDGDKSPKGHPSGPPSPHPGH